MPGWYRLLWWLASAAVVAGMFSSTADFEESLKSVQRTVSGAHIRYAWGVSGSFISFRKISKIESQWISCKNRINVHSVTSASPVIHLFNLGKISMLVTTLSSLNGIPAFLAYFTLALVSALLFVRIYTWVTPQDELALIRANNPAAALAFGGALVGFALPLSSAITHSLSLADCAVWGAVALLVQVLAFVVLRIVIKKLPERIRQGEVATGIFVAASAIAVGLINAACMSY